MIKEERLEFYSATLALMIHWIVLFSNIDKFVNHLALEVFLANNPVSFLLADFYHAFHTMHEKIGWNFLFCAPLLHLWMRTRMPQRGPFAYSNFSWARRSASLSASSILWYKIEWETKDVISRCEGFTNVPLIGTHGCINYNPVLLKRQMGYAMLKSPKDRDLVPFIINIVDALNSTVKRVKKSWTCMIRIDQEWEKKNILAKEPYFMWVKERARVVKIPFLYDSSSRVSNPMRSSQSARRD